MSINHHILQKPNNNNMLNNFSREQFNTLDYSPITSYYNKKNKNNYNSYKTYNDMADEEEKNDFDDDYDNENKNQVLRNQYNLSDKVLNDFKNIIKETQIIKNKILQKSQDIENNIFDNSYFDTSKSNFTNMRNIHNNNINNFDLELDGYLINDNNSNNISKNENTLSLTKKINPDETMKKQLNQRNKYLIDINSEINLENNLLESEISLYKQKNSNSFWKNKHMDNNSNNIFYQSLEKFINNLKLSFQKNIESNKDLIKKLLNELNKYKDINNNNIKQKSEYDNLQIKIQKQKERIADICKYNIENNKRYLYLKDEQEILNKTAKRLKSNLMDLKSKGKNLTFKNDKSRKKNNDSKEIIVTLQKTISNLKNENSFNNKITMGKNNKLIMKKNSLDLYNDKINQLYLMINNIQNDKNIVLEENMNMKKEIEKNNLGLVGENNKLIKENELKVELNEYKLKNYNIEKQIKRKDELVKKMKNIIKQFTSDVNNNETEYKDLKKQISIILKSDINYTHNENQINNIKLSKEINEKLNLDIKLNNEINSIMKKYEEIINQKDKEILLLENEIGKNEVITQKNNNFQFNKEEPIKITNNIEEYEEDYNNEIENNKNNSYVQESNEEYIEDGNDLGGSNNKNIGGDVENKNLKN